MNRPPRQSARVLLGCVGATAAAVTVASAIAVAGPAGADAPPSPWLQTGYNAANSHANIAETTLSAGNLSQLRLQRTITARDESGCSGGISAVALSESRIYATANDVLTAYNSATGKIIWNTTIPVLDDDDVDQIAVSQGQVIVKGNECGTNDPEGFVGAFNSQTGKSVWNHTYPDGVSAMEASGDYVVAHVHGGIEANPLTAVYRVSDGKTVWSTAGNETAYCDAQPSVIYGLVFVNYCNGNSTQLRARRLATGALVWEKNGSFTVLGGDSDTSSAHHILVSNGTSVSDLNPKNGATRYSLGAAGVFIAADSSHVYFSGPDYNDPISAYNIATGQRLWQYTKGNPVPERGVEANGVLYLDNGVALNAANGSYLRTLARPAALVGSGRIGAITSTGNLALYGL